MTQHDPAWPSAVDAPCRPSHVWDHVLLTAHRRPTAVANTALGMLAGIANLTVPPPLETLLPPTYCLYLLPTAYYLLSTAHCLPPTTYHLPPTTYYLLPTTYYLLPTTYSHSPRFT